MGGQGEGGAGEGGCERVRVRSGRRLRLLYIPQLWAAVEAALGHSSPLDHTRKCIEGTGGLFRCIHRDSFSKCNNSNLNDEAWLSQEKSVDRRSEVLASRVPNEYLQRRIDLVDGERKTSHAQ